MVGQAQQERRPFSFVFVYDVTGFGRLDNDEAGHHSHIFRIHVVREQRTRVLDAAFQLHPERFARGHSTLAAIP